MKKMILAGALGVIAVTSGFGSGLPQLKNKPTYVPGIKVNPPIAVKNRNSQLQNRSLDAIKNKIKPLPFKVYTPSEAKAQATERAKKEEERQNAFLEAFRAKNPEAVQSLIKKYGQVTTKDLNAAIRYGDSAIVRTLLEDMVQKVLSFGDHMIMDPMYFPEFGSRAMEEGIKIVQEMMQEKRDDQQAITDLEKTKGYLEEARGKMQKELDMALFLSPNSYQLARLIECGADVTAKDMGITTLLGTIIYTGDEKQLAVVLKYMVKNGMDLQEAKYYFDNIGSWLKALQMIPDDFSGRTVGELKRDFDLKKGVLDSILGNTFAMRD